MKRMKEKRGITLIALVVTIIILLILAGIALSITFGEGGLIQRSINATAKTDIASTRERIELELVGKYDNNGNYTNDDVIGAVKIATGQDIKEGAEIITTDKGNEVDISDLWKEIEKTEPAVPEGKWTDNGDASFTSEKGTTVYLGDYIDYDTSNLTSNTYTSYSVTNASSDKNNGRTSGYTDDQTFTASDYTGKWVVLGVNDEGNLEITSEGEVSSYILQGPLGYYNGVNELNSICNIYSDGEIGIKGRSRNMSDYLYWFDFDPKTDSGYGNYCSWQWECTYFDYMNSYYTSLALYTNNTRTVGSDAESFSYLDNNHQVVTSSYPGVFEWDFVEKLYSVTTTGYTINTSSRANKKQDRSESYIKGSCWLANQYIYTKDTNLLYGIFVRSGCFAGCRNLYNPVGILFDSNYGEGWMSDRIGSGNNFR